MAMLNNQMVLGWFTSSLDFFFGHFLYGSQMNTGFCWCLPPFESRKKWLEALRGWTAAAGEVFGREDGTRTWDEADLPGEPQSSSSNRDGLKCVFFFVNQKAGVFLWEKNKCFLADFGCPCHSYFVPNESGLFCPKNAAGETWWPPWQLHAALWMPSRWAAEIWFVSWQILADSWQIAGRTKASICSID